MNPERYKQIHVGAVLSHRNHGVDEQVFEPVKTKYNII